MIRLIMHARTAKDGGFTTNIDILGICCAHFLILFLEAGKQKRIDPTAPWTAATSFVVHGGRVSGCG